MLTRLTRGARGVVAGAYEFAVQDRSPEIAEEHLLAALLDDDEGRVLFADVGDRDQIRAEVELARQQGGVTAAESTALAGLGIDVDAVVRQIEEHFGADALAGSGSRAPSRWRPSMSGNALLVMDAAERHLDAAGGRSLGVEHLALGLVSASGVVSDALARRGFTVATVQASVAAARPRGGRG